MLRAQVSGWKAILEGIDCDNTGPVIGPDFGSAITASTYGCDLVEREDDFPAYSTWFASDEDLSRLESIDPRTNGLRSVELDFREQYRAMADEFSIRYEGGDVLTPAREARLGTGSEGPFSIACMIAGFDNVSLWCYDNPALVKKLVGIITAKEIERIRYAFSRMGEPATEANMADDYSPFVAAEMYEEFILPYQKQLMDAFGRKTYFHSCIPDRRLLPRWRDELNICHLNGPKPQHGLASLKSDLTPVAEAIGGRASIEIDIDGPNVMIASEEELRQAALDFLEVFGSHRGVALCATLSGGHDPDDLAKMNVLKKTSNRSAPYAASCSPDP